MRLFLLVLLGATLLPFPAFALDIHGFIEGAYGARFEKDKTEKDGYNLLEGRLQLRAVYYPAAAGEMEPELVFKADLLADGYAGTAEGLLRDAYLSFTPLDNMDVKAGRQILTWGTGDFLFINDLFPKDYVSFFTGRDDEYLKLPSDALKVSLFFDAVNADIVLIPFFAANESIKGKRLSYYNGLMGRITGKEGTGKFTGPDGSAGNMEQALRIYRTFGSVEAALYLFNGFYKEPLGVKDPEEMEFFYPELTVYGLSLRGALLGGIGNLEIGYYDSRQDRDGRDAMIENPGIKYLAGYSKDLPGDLKIGVQYQLEQVLAYGEYLDALQEGAPEADEFRRLITVRLYVWNIIS